MIRASLRTLNERSRRWGWFAWAWDRLLPRRFKWEVRCVPPRKRDIDAAERVVREMGWATADHFEPVATTAPKATGPLRPEVAHKQESPAVQSGEGDG